MACRVCHYKNLQINSLYGQVSQLSGQIRSYCKTLIASRTNGIVMRKEMLVAVWTYQIVLEKADCP